MTTASVLLTVNKQWGLTGDKSDKDELTVKSRDISTIASRELRETPSTREQALRIMRSWISQNADIKDVRQDDSFLLRFLRHKKFSIPMAQQTILKYLNLRQYYPESFGNLDCEEQKMQEIINNRYVVVSPIRDAKGRRVIIYNMGNFNPTKFTCWDLCRAHALVYESLLEDPANQVLGFTHVGDSGGTTAAHITFWNPIDLARLMKWGEQSLPMRHKECHLVNVSPTIKYAIDFAISKLTVKMADRIHIHTALTDLHKHVPVECLPQEYGGTITFDEMVDYTKSLLKEQRTSVVNLDKMMLISTQGIISSKRSTTNTNKGIESVQGSFRKLEID